MFTFPNISKTELYIKNIQLFKRFGFMRKISKYRETFSLPAYCNTRYIYQKYSEYIYT